MRPLGTRAFQQQKQGLLNHAPMRFGLLTLASSSFDVGSFGAAVLSNCNVSGGNLVSTAATSAFSASWALPARYTTKNIFMRGRSVFPTGDAGANYLGLVTTVTSVDGFVAGWRFTAADTSVPEGLSVVAGVPTAQTNGSYLNTTNQPGGTRVFVIPNTGLMIDNTTSNTFTAALAGMTAMNLANTPAVICQGTTGGTIGDILMGASGTAYALEVLLL